MARAGGSLRVSAAHGVTASLETFIAEPASARALESLSALSRAAMQAGTNVAKTSTYQGIADLLLCWGPGAPNRRDAMRAQINRGGHAVALDLGYWDRDQRTFRVTIDAPHPQHWIDKWPADPTRLELAPPLIADRYDPTGPVIVAGIGVKASVQYGAATVQQWERREAERATATGRKVLYRAKPPEYVAPVGFRATPGGTSIEKILTGASAVITWHSNVAVDAIRLGIPVVCVDGAAAAVSRDGWPADGVLEPLAPKARDAFLARLAWFQWQVEEAAACWRFLETILA